MLNQSKSDRTRPSSPFLRHLHHHSGFFSDSIEDGAALAEYRDNDVYSMDVVNEIFFRLGRGIFGTDNQMRTAVSGGECNSSQMSTNIRYSLAFSISNWIWQWL